ncbi:Cytochrome P450 monooxygenase [Lachnellula suecica]|uniref:Cytochrome P450 monooxygenase n=1 Tax=Lachnellula suecica TaxID=602035 RepID=A0A8T9C1L8_9HELO|nr:Cytochrome P450 monooxygenase [Lachnellula suecica]
MMTLQLASIGEITWDWKSLVSIALLFGASLGLVRTFHAWYRLRHIKGPFLASFSKLWLIRTVSSGNMHWECAKVCETYGSLARVGPNFLITSDPEQMRKMLSVRSLYRRSDWYVGMRFDPSSENVASERNDEKHTALRAKMAAGYSGKEVPNLETSVDQNVAAFIALIDKYVTTGSDYKPLDFGRKAQYFTLDVITTLAFGRAFGFVATDSDVFDYIKTVEETLPAAQMVTVLPWINWVLQMRLVKRFLPSEKDPIGFGKLMGITKEMVGQRFGQRSEGFGEDILGSFIRHGLSQEEVESETILQIIAGSDTTAVAIRIICLYLITTPRVLERFRAEYSNASISSPIQDIEARNLPYLQAIIKEGLRIWPPVVGLMAKEVPAGGDIVNGLFVPGGTSIGYCAFGMFRDKKIFGDDADTFRPERWLDSSPEKTKEQEQTLELIFSYGKYQCMGRNVALMELNKVFVEIFRRFDFAVVDPQKPIGFNICMGVFAISDFWVTVTRREGSPA